MKIGIDISQIAYPGSGVSRFVAGVVGAICEYDKKNEWHFVFSSLRGSIPQETLSAITKRGYRLHRLPIPPTLLSKLWNSAHVFDVQSVTGPLDWFITSDWTEPPASCKKATVIHDLAYLRYPETVAPLVLETQKARMRHVVKETDTIFADSESTKKDIIKLLEINPSKVVVNYPGLAAKTDAGRTPLNPVVNRPFLLTVGKREPRKNIEKLINAYEQIRPPGIDLVIAGDRGWGETAKLESASNKIHFLGYVSDSELSVLYTECLGFIYPSVWEGFGYPVIEAMSYGAPVATSETSSLGEIASDAALLFNPSSVDEIAASIKKLTTDERLRRALSEKGKKRAAEFTWKRYYESMMEALS